MATLATRTYPKVSEIIKDAIVISQMDKAWNLMKSTASSAGRFEYGFYIYYNHNTQRYYVGRVEVGLPAVGCRGTNANIELGKVINNPDCCAFFHCHTTLHFCSREDFRATGPSPTDLDFARNRNLPGILYDYARFEIEGGHSINERHKIYPFGPDQRPDMHY